MDESLDAGVFNPYRLAVLYYFGDLQCWKLPDIAAEALGLGYDGIALRKVAGLTDPVESDLRPEDIHSAFQEMGVSAPIPKDAARLVLATESARRALNGESNVFDEATHIRIHLCELGDPAPELHRIVSLSQQAQNAPRGESAQLEGKLKRAISDFLKSRDTLTC